MRKEQVRAEADRKEKEAALLAGNPLTRTAMASHGYSLKRKWHEETVFKNQARSERK